MQEVFEKIIEKLEGKLTELEKVSNFKLSQKQKAQNYGYFVAIDHTIGIVEQASNEYNNGWIPVEDRLPETFDNVIVCTKEGGRAIAHRCPNQALGRYYDLHGSAINNIIAWQPLPESYQQSNICTESDCPYNEGKNCQAAEGCAGYQPKGE